MKMKNGRYTEKQATKLRDRLAEIVDEHKRASMDLCWACYETYNAYIEIGGEPVAVWTLWDYDSWSDCVNIELGLHQTTAYQYKRIWETFYVNLASAWDVKLLLPVTKMRILCAAGLNRRNVNAWLRRGAKMTCSKLVAEVYGTDELRNLAVPVTSDELETINEVINEAREVFGKEPRGVILTKVLREWRGVHRKVKRARKGRGRLKIAS